MTLLWFDFMNVMATKYHPNDMVVISAKIIGRNALSYKLLGSHKFSTDYLSADVDPIIFDLADILKRKKTVKTADGFFIRETDINSTPLVDNFLSTQASGDAEENINSLSGLSTENEDKKNTLVLKSIKNFYWPSFFSYDSYYYLDGPLNYNYFSFRVHYYHVMSMHFLFQWNQSLIQILNCIQYNLYIHLLYLTRYNLYKISKFVLYFSSLLSYKRGKNLRRLIIRLRRHFLFRKRRLRRTKLNKRQKFIQLIRNSY